MKGLFITYDAIKCVTHDASRIARGNTRILNSMHVARLYHVALSVIFKTVQGEIIEHKMSFKPDSKMRIGRDLGLLINAYYKQAIDDIERDFIGALVESIPVKITVRA